MKPIRSKLPAVAVLPVSVPLLRMVCLCSWTPFWVSHLGMPPSFCLIVSHFQECADQDTSRSSWSLHSWAFPTLSGSDLCYHCVRKEGCVSHKQGCVHRAFSSPVLVKHQQPRNHTVVATVKQAPYLEQKVGLCAGPCRVGISSRHCPSTAFHHLSDCLPFSRIL